MWNARLDIATTSFVAERETAKGFEGSVTIEQLFGSGVRVEERLWMCKVASHEAEMRREEDAA